MTMLPIRPLLYIAAPYTRPDPVVNTNAVCRLATVIFEQTKWAPVVPHLSLLWHLVTPRPIEHWYRLDLHVLAHCDAIVRCPGESTGADDEVILAADFKWMVTVKFEDLPDDAQRIWRESR